MKPIRICIVEDENPAARRIERLLLESPYPTEVVIHVASVAEGIKLLPKRTDLDLIMMDIRLGDGTSLEILEKAEIDVPIIFTTAYDEYTLKAFKHQSIDYLLKPVDGDELYAAMAKYIRIYKNEDELRSIPDKTFTYKERFLVKSGNHLRVIRKEDIAYFYSEEGYTHIVCEHGKKYLLDDTLDTITRLLDPKDYFRINRSMIIRHQCIDNIESYFNSRYIVKLIPAFHDQAIVSREKVRDFKEWLEG
jgi:two-component system, LytTR family, response regulator LytT